MTDQKYDELYGFYGLWLEQRIELVIMLYRLEVLPAKTALKELRRLRKLLTKAEQDHTDKKLAEQAAYQAQPIWKRWLLPAPAK